MPQIFVVEATLDDEVRALVGVYTSLERVIAATDAYAAWHDHFKEGFRVTLQLLDVNNSSPNRRWDTFMLAPGKVPEYLLRKVPHELRSRFSLQTENAV